MPLKYRFALVFTAAFSLLLGLFSYGLYVFVETKTLEHANENLTSLLEHEREHLGLAHHRGAKTPGVAHFNDVYVRIKKSGEVMFDSFAENFSEPNAVGIYETPPIIFQRINRRFQGEEYEITAYYDLKPTLAYFELLRQALWLGALAAMIIIVPLSLLLTSHLLTPFRNLARLTSNLDAQHLSYRFPSVSANDEIGFLTENFNLLLLKLEASFNHIRRFSAQVSHELKTPLAVMVSQTEYLLRKPRSEQQVKETHLKILGKARDLSSMVDKILALSEVERSEKLDEKEIVVVEECVKEEIETLRAAHNSFHREIIFRNDMGGGSRLNINPVLFKTVLRNVLENAIKFATFKIEVTFASSEGKTTLKVEDDGPGIPPHQREHVFGHLNRLLSAEPKIKGYGLGLTIVKACLDAMKWQISLSESKWGGLALELEIPESARA